MTFQMEWICPGCDVGHQVTVEIDDPDHSVGYPGDINVALPEQCGCGYEPTDADRADAGDRAWDEQYNDPT